MLTVPLDLSSTLDLDGGRAWVGFTAATGGGWQNHDILNWEYGLRIEPTAIVSIDNTSAIEGNQAGNQLLFPVTATRLGDTSEPVTVQVHYATADGTAQDGGAGEDNDYQATAGTLTFEFAAGQMELAQTIAVTLQGDVVEEADETITLTLSAAANATISGGVAVGTILNDESTISIDDATAVEGSASLRIIDRLIDANGVVSGPMRSLALGPDGNGDGRQDLYVVNAGNDEVLRYDGLSGAPIDVFVSSGAGGLANPVDLRFGPDGNLYVTSGGTSATHSRTKFSALTDSPVHSSTWLLRACSPRSASILATTAISMSPIGTPTPSSDSIQPPVSRWECSLRTRPAPQATFAWRRSARISTGTVCEISTSSTGRRRKSFAMTAALVR